jgi:hypothetical protein
MAENKESSELLTKLALIAESSQKLFAGKASLVFELREQEYYQVVSEIEGNYDNETFKIEISGTDFIFILDK